MILRQLGLSKNWDGDISSETRISFREYGIIGQPLETAEKTLLKCEVKLSLEDCNTTLSTGSTVICYPLIELQSNNDCSNM